MKIGFPYLKKKASGDVLMDATFHTCIAFGIYDDEKEEVELIEAEKVANEVEGGLLAFFKKNGVANLISPKCHTMAAKFFQDNHLNIFRALSDDLLENVMMLKNRMLQPFGVEEVLASSCGTDCGACSSDCSSK